MKSISVSDISLSVRKILDEIGTNDSDFISIEIGGEVYDKDNYELDVIIKDKIIQAVNFIHKYADYSLINGIRLTGTLVLNSNLSGYLPLPTVENLTFLRLISFKMSDWLIPVQNVIYEDNPEYIKQFDEFARGTFERPVCVINNKNIVPDGEMAQVLEFFSCKSSTSSLEYAYYIQKQDSFFDDGGTDKVYICERLEKAILHLIASFTLATYKDPASETLMQMANTFAEINT